MSRTKPTGDSAPLSTDPLYEHREKALDQSADTLKTISELQDHTTAVQGQASGSLDASILGMKEVVVNVASEMTGGQLDKTREELSKRGLGDLLE